MVRGTPFMDPDVRLRLNDHLGIDVQMLSPNPITYFHHVEPEVAAEFCRWHNDELADLVAGHPDRFLGAAQTGRCATNGSASTTSTCPWGSCSRRPWRWRT